MTPRTSKGILVVMGPIGWFLACVFGVLACMLAAESRGNDIPWQILGSLVVGSMLASIPVGFTLLAAYYALDERRATPQSDPNLIGNDQQLRGASWRWTTFAILCGLESLVLPLSIAAAAAEDDSLMLSIPFNLVIITAIVFVACFPHRQRASTALCTIHLIGIVIATFAAAIEIESVIVSGMFLMITAIILAIVGSRPAVARVVFALSAIAFIVTSFLVIAIGNVSQHQAESPLFAAMVAYQILFAPLGLWVLYRESSGRTLPLGGQFGLKQFGLKQLLAAMAMVCVASAMTKLAFSVDDDLRVAIAVGLGALFVMAIGVTLVAAGWSKWSGEALRWRKSTVA